MSGQLSMAALIIGVLLVPFVFIKSLLFFALMTRFKLRARTSLLATLNLSNYSEFGLIIAAIGVSNGWMDANWLVIIAIALSFSFIIAAPLNKLDHKIYSQFKRFWLQLQSKERLPDDRYLDTLGASIAIFGMGRVGRGAYDKMREFHGETVVGVDFDEERVKQNQKIGRNILLGDPSDIDFWEKVEKDHSIKLVMLALPSIQANMDALEQLQAISYSGRISAVARYPEELSILQKAGATDVFNIYTEAGTGFAEHVKGRDKLNPYY
jgi:voltage-gated potassium channel Kch